MIDPWFTQEVSLRFTLLSFFSLLALLEVYVAKGRHRRAVTGALLAGVATGVILLALAVLAGIGAQPRYVLIALGVPGIVLTVVFMTVLASLPSRYAATELRRMASKEI